MMPAPALDEEGSTSNLNNNVAALLQVIEATRYMLQDMDCSAYLSSVLCLRSKKHANLMAVLTTLGKSPASHWTSWL